MVQFAREHGHKWVLLHSKGFLPSRTVSGIKQRWYDTIKHKLDAKGDPTPAARVMVDRFSTGRWQRLTGPLMSSGRRKSARMPVFTPGPLLHDRLRSQCKECGGSSICQHNRRRSACNQCRGIEKKQRKNNKRQSSPHSPGMQKDCGLGTKQRCQWR